MDLLTINDRGNTMFTSPPVHYNGIRFSIGSKESLVRWINTVNNRNFTADDFVFDVPVPDGNDGWVYITGKYLPSDEPITLRVQRVDLSKLNGINPLVIHSRAFDKQSIADAIFDQYGILLELDLFELDIIKEDISNVIGNHLNGFGSDEGIDVIDSLEYGDGEGTIRILPSHLTLEGTIDFKIRASMLSFDSKIDSVLSLREFYSTHDDLKPFVETIQPKGTWTLDKAHFGSMSAKKEVEAKLYEMTLSPDTVVDYVFLAQVLTSITGQQWTSENNNSPFNVMGSIIKYNGVAGKYPNVAPIAYSYLMILELSELCSNLQGDVHIAYQYANHRHPLYGNKTLAGIPPL